MASPDDDGRKGMENGTDASGDGSETPGDGTQAAEDQTEVSGDLTVEANREFPCTNCTQGTPASHYCPKCDIFFCKPCLWDLCDHGALGRLSMAKWGQPTPLLEEDCDRHPGNTIQLYCADHDTVGCCMCYMHQGFHRPCQAVYIPDVAVSMDQSGNIPKVKRDLKKMMKTIKGMKSNQQQRQATLKKSHNKVKTVIKSYRKRLNTILDKLEKQSEEDVNNFQQSVNDKIQIYIDTLNIMEMEVEKFQERLEKIGRNTSQVFTRVKRYQEWLNDTEKAILEIGASQCSDKIEYSLSNKLEKLMAEVVSYGTINTPETVYTVKKMKEYPIKIDKDENRCNITSICQVEDGEYVITDNDNNRLKLLDKSFKIIDDCDLANWPWSVCSLHDREVIVTMGGNQVQFVIVASGLKPGESYKLNHSCFGIAFGDHKVYISDQYKSIYMYRMYRSTLQLDSMVRIGTSLLGQPRNLAINPEGSIIYVADCDKGVVAIAPDGQVIATFKPREIKTAFGVCVAPNGYVFMVGNESENLVQLDRKGEKKIKELVPQSKGLTKPQGICIDVESYRLVVVGVCNQIRVFDIAQEG